MEFSTGLVVGESVCWPIAGLAVGDAVGRAVGCMVVVVGFWVGPDVVREMLGDTVGAPESIGGDKKGAAVGCCVGKEVGILVGKSVMGLVATGAKEGRIVGLLVGAADVGRRVGTAVTIGLDGVLGASQHAKKAPASLGQQFPAKA